VAVLRKSSHYNFCRFMSMRNGEKMGIVAPSPKRRKLGHAGVNQQDEARRSSDRESGENTNHLAAPKVSSTVLMQRELNASNSRAKDSHLATTRSGGMSRSSMFKLQADEMLLAVQPNYAKIMGPIDKALHRLKILIESIEDREPLTVRTSPLQVWSSVLMLLLRLQKPSSPCIKLTRSRFLFQKSHPPRI
jgi:hypothetical protein